MATETVEATAAAVTERLHRALALLDRLDLPDGVHLTVNVADYGHGDGTGGSAISIHSRTPESLRQIRRAVGVMRKDEAAGGGMVLRGKVDGFEVTVWPPIDSCKRVQVGTQTVEREVPTATETVTEEVPVYEWDCGDVLRDEQVPA